MRLIKIVKNPALINAASRLMQTGYLNSSSEKLTYLDIDDDYIHQLCPLLKDKKIKKPHYFGSELIGAHISVIYPEENISVNAEDLGQEHQFTIKGAFSAELDFQKYYVLMVESFSLLALRRKYGLSDRLCFRGHWVDFHITIGVFS